MENAYDALDRRIESVEHVDVATGAALADPNVTVHVYVSLAPIAEYAVTTNRAGGYNAGPVRRLR